MTALPAERFARSTRLAWHAGLYSATAGLQRVAGFALFLWFARTLSVREYAMFGLLYAAQTGVMTFALAGIVEAVVGQLRNHRSPAERRALYTTASKVFGLTSLVAGAIAGLGFVFFAEQPGLAFLTVGSAVASGALLAYASLEAQILRLEEKPLTSLLFSFAVPLAALAGGFVGFVVRPAVESYFIGSVAGGLIAVLGLWRWREGFHVGTAPTISARAVFLAGSPFIVVAFFGWVTGYGNNYIVNFVFKPIEVAKFTFALTLSSILQLVATALNQVWSPRFYQMTHHEPIERVELKNRHFFRLQAIALGLGGGLLLAVFPPAMRALGGNFAAYQSMGLELALLLGYYVLAVPVWHCQNYFLAYGRGTELMKVTISTGIAGIALWVLLMAFLGPIGIYVGFIAQVVIRVLGSTLTARKHWPITIAWDGVASGLALVSVGYLISRL